MSGQAWAWWTRAGEAAARVDRKALALGVLLAVGCGSLALEERRNRLAWTELPLEGTGRASRSVAAADAGRTSVPERPGSAGGGVAAASRKASRPAGPAGGPGRTAPRSTGRGGPLDLNRATAGELDALPGIGPALAQRVVAYRVANGPYRSVADLEKVSGIGPGRLARLSGLVRVEESGGDGQ